jgi:3-oxoacyl-[acyl-carrier protein] reductase
MGLIHWLAGAYAKKGITMNGVAPALIGDTKMLPGNSQELAKSKSPPQVQGSEKHDRGLVGGQGPDHSRLHPTCVAVEADTCRGVPLGVVGRPDEIAETVVWMVKTGYLTNKVVIVDGGMLPQ